MPKLPSSSRYACNRTMLKLYGATCMLAEGPRCPQQVQAAACRGVGGNADHITTAHTRTPNKVLMYSRA